MDEYLRNTLLDICEVKCPYLNVDDSDATGLIWVCNAFGEWCNSREKMCGGCALGKIFEEGTYSVKHNHRLARRHMR